ncbi:ABC transporter ATP-binding protein [soil metagenome]
MQSGVRFNQLSVTYSGSRGALKAVGPLTLDVAEGEFVALLGPSGCGKSTLLSVAAGLLAPTDGQVSIAGGERRRGDIGIVFQQPTLLPWKTVRDNVLVPATLMGLDAQRHGRRADELIEMVGLTGFGAAYPHELSGGMQQRVAIARALIADPKVLLLDEPFAALDALTREQMTLELQTIWERSRKTVILVTHSIQEAVFMADRIVVLSTRPARIIHIEPVDLPRPRGLDTMAAPEMAALSDRLRRLLGSQPLAQSHQALPA